MVVRQRMKLVVGQRMRMVTRMMMVVRERMTMVVNERMRMVERQRMATLTMMLVLTWRPACSRPASSCRPAPSPAAPPPAPPAAAGGSWGSGYTPGHKRHHRPGLRRQVVGRRDLLASCVAVRPSMRSPTPELRHIASSSLWAWGRGRWERWWRWWVEDLSRSRWKS